MIACYVDHQKLEKGYKKITVHLSILLNMLINRLIIIESKPSLTAIGLVYGFTAAL